ncbi:MAG: PRC-barrel domain containing protein [Solirubrobacterales bacterium]
MLRSVKSLRGVAISALDGEMGKVDSFLFDDHKWTIRYLVVDTGRWLPGRKVLIAPTALGRSEGQGPVLPVNLTKEQVRNSPDIDTDKPVSRQREAELRKYYDWAPYWGFGYGLDLPSGERAEADRGAVAVEHAQGDTHLRSTKDVRGYRIHAIDGEIGHVEDFIVSDVEWVVRYLAIDTGKWLAPRHVLISPDWVRDIGWDEREVWVDVTIDAIEKCPLYDPTGPISREYETQVYDYYGRQKYWK